MFLNGHNRIEFEVHDRHSMWKDEPLGHCSIVPIYSYDVQDTWLPIINGDGVEMCSLHIVFNFVDVAEWTMDEVALWLETDASLSDTVRTAFTTHEINGAHLLALTEDSLKTDLQLPLGPQMSVAAMLRALHERQVVLGKGVRGVVPGGAGGGGGEAIGTPTAMQPFHVFHHNGEHHFDMSGSFGESFASLDGSASGSSQPARVASLRTLAFARRGREDSLSSIASATEGDAGLLRLRCFVGAETYTIPIPETCGWREAQAKIMQTIGPVSRVEYSDPYNLMVRITSQAGYDAAKLCKEEDTSTLSLYITTKASTPRSVTKRSGSFSGSSRSLTPRQGKIRYKRGHILGVGGCGAVYLGRDLDTGTLMAVKQVETYGKDLDELRERYQKLYTELEFLKTLSHPHIVQYYGADMKDDGDDGHLVLTIFLEYVASGTLSSLMKKMGPLDEQSVRMYTRQILLGLVYLHSKRVVHCDIKADNVLLCLFEDKQICKLADFGAAKAIQDISEHHVEGTTYFMPPEVVRLEGNVFASDVWSLGATVVEMLTGKPPWSHLPEEKALMFIGGLPDNPNFELPEVTVSDEGRDFLTFCFQPLVENRPSSESLLEHPWILGVGGDFDDGEMEGEESSDSSVLSD